MSSIISVKGLDCSYGKEKILSNISFDIEKESITFIMGNNGTGKTTLLNCLLNNIPFDADEISYLGEPPKQMTREKLAKIISYVPQNVDLNCDFKVKDYLLLGRNPYISFGNPKAIDYEIVESYAKQTGIINIVERPFNTLSGGQKQWVAITRALIQQTPILIMDEPMSALDLGKQGDFLNLLLELSKLGKTIILTSHNPMHAIYLPMSRVCLLNDKKILSYGSPREVFSQENITAVYGDKVSIDEHGIVLKV